MSDIELSVACGDYDRTHALHDGRVGVEGCAVTTIRLEPEEVFFRAFGNAEFDVAELSFSTYSILTARGACPYVAIPVFLSRAFRHSAIYVRTDRGIARPQDLVGRRIGIPEYQVTAAVWVRGLLEDEYGVSPGDLRWVSGGVEEAGRHEKVPIALPADVSMEAAPAGRPLARLLADGELDGLVAPRPPSCFRAREPHVGRLFADYRAVEQAYFRKTGLFPIMHLVGVRRALVERHPWLPASVFKAFAAARSACLPALDNLNALAFTLPWLVAETEATRAVMGDDFWPYGIEPNRQAIETLAGYLHRQGLTGRRLAVEDLFAAGTVAQVRI